MRHMAIISKSQIWAVWVPPGGFDGFISPLILITVRIYISYPGDLYCAVNAGTNY